MRSLTTLAAFAGAALILAACGGNDGDDPAALEDGAIAVEVGEDDPESDVDDTPADDSDTTDAGDGSASEEETTDAGADAGEDTDATGGSAVPVDAFDPWTDASLGADPGRWAVGDSGWIEFDRTDDGLVLLDVREASGWTARVDEEDADELEVEFRSGNVTRTIEVEIDDGRLEIDIDTDIEPADPGTYDVGAAGSFTFERDGDRLRLLDVSPASGWDVRVDEEDDDEIEFVVTSGNQRWKVEIELDDGEVELEIDYRVRG